MTNPEINDPQGNSKRNDLDRRNMTANYEDEKTEVVARAYASGEPAKYTSSEIESKEKVVVTSDFAKPTRVVETTTTVVETVETHTKPAEVKRTEVSKAATYETSPDNYASNGSRHRSKPENQQTGYQSVSSVQKMRSSLQDYNKYSSKERESDPNAVASSQAAAKAAEKDLQSSLLEQKK